MSKKILHGYQREAVNAARAVMIADKRAAAILAMATGSGKSLVNADMALRAVNKGVRALCLVDSALLVEQNYIEFIEYAGDIHTTIYSDQIKKYDFSGRAVFGGIQSYHKVSAESGPFGLIIIDEGHMISPKKKSMYFRTIETEIAKNPAARIVILTATPYRLDSGMLDDLEMPCGIQPVIAYETDMIDLIQLGYLAPPVSISSDVKVDLSGLKLSGKDYSNVAAGKRFLKLIPQHVPQIIAHGVGRKCGLVFAQNIEHAEALAAELSQYERVGIIHGKTDGGSKENAETIRLFKSGHYRLLINVGIAVKGFNHKPIDFIVICLATISISKLLQIIGRGSRALEGKENYLVLDFGDHAARLGRLDEITKPKKKKPGDGDVPQRLCDCGKIIPMVAKSCEFCGFIFPVKPRTIGKNLTKKAKGGLFSTDYEPQKVTEWEFMSYTRRDGVDGLKLRLIDDLGKAFHTEYYNLNADSKWVASECWKRLEQLAPGIKKMRGYPANIVAQAVNKLNAGGAIKQIESVLLMPDSKAKFLKIHKYNRSN